MQNLIGKTVNRLANWLSSFAYSKLSRKEARLIIERFLNDQSHDDYEWRDFLDSASRDPAIENARLEIWSIFEKHHNPHKRVFCDTAGMGKIREVANSLKGTEEKQHSDASLCL